MAGKPTNMSQIKQLLKLHEQGHAIKAIARTIGISKNTVKSYLTKLALLAKSTDKPLSVHDLIQLPDPELEGIFHAGNPSYKDDRYTYLKGLLAHYQKELKRTGVTKNLLWQEYKEACTNGYGYAQFCFHLQQYLTASKPSMVLQHKAADKLFIDFAGKKLSYTCQNSGEIINCEVFVACLPYSDYSFVFAVHRQSSDDFIYALTRCLLHIGGVPQAIVSDNLKAAVKKANRYEPEVNHILTDLANHYGTTIVPARAYKPKDKALVENQVNLIYTRVYAKLRNSLFFDIESLNAAIAGLVLHHNQTRMQQKPYSREERFLAEEQPLLLPLTSEAFEIKYYAELKVAANNHIYLSCDKHYYSVPYSLIGSKVKVIYTRNMVYIYQAAKQVAVHIRNYQHGTYTTQKEHLCSQHQHYLSRSPAYYIGLAKTRSEVLHNLFELIFKKNRYPEQLYKSCDGLLSLQRRVNAEAFNKACQMAIDHQNYTYTFIKNIIENKMAEHNDKTVTEAKPLPVHPNVRGKQYYQQALDFSNQ